jgi:hypothetical protein
MLKRKVSGYEGHHINSVKGHQEMAGNPANIRFVTRNEHLYEYHQGNWRNPSSGVLMTRE